MTGGAATVSEAFEVFPVPPFVALTTTLLFFTPAVVPVTFMLKVHEPLAARVAPVNDVAPAPAAAVIVPPPHVPVRPFGVAITIPVGKVSANAIPVSAIVFATGFVIVKLSEVDPFSATVAAPNAFAIVGGVFTVRLALAVFPVPPFVEPTAPVVFVKLPAAAPRTLTTMVQEAPAAIVPPDKITLPEFGEAPTVPVLQAPTNPFGAATTNPAGKLSVNATLVSAAVFPTGLVIVKVSEVVPFNPILAAPNAFIIDGGASTDRLADAVNPSRLPSMPPHS